MFHVAQLVRHLSHRDLRRFQLLAGLGRRIASFFRIVDHVFQRGSSLIRLAFNEKLVGGLELALRYAHANPGPFVYIRGLRPSLEFFQRLFFSRPRSQRGHEQKCKNYGLFTHSPISWVRWQSAGAAPATPGRETVPWPPPGSDDNSPPPACNPASGRRRWREENNRRESPATTWHARPKP